MLSRQRFLDESEDAEQREAVHDCERSEDSTPSIGVDDNATEHRRRYRSNYRRDVHRRKELQSKYSARTVNDYSSSDDHAGSTGKPLEESQACKYLDRRSEDAQHAGAEGSCSSRDHGSTPPPLIGEL